MAKQKKNELSFEIVKGDEMTGDDLDAIASMVAEWIARRQQAASTDNVEVEKEKP